MVFAKGPILVLVRFSNADVVVLADLSFSKISKLWRDNRGANQPHVYYVPVVIITRFRYQNSWIIHIQVQIIRGIFYFFLRYHMQTVHTDIYV